MGDYAPVKKRTVWCAGFQTSISIEQPFWDEIKRIARERKVPIGTLLADIAAESGGCGNFSSAIRQFVLFEVQGQANGAAARADAGPRSLPSLNRSVEVQP